MSSNSEQLTCSLQKYKEWGENDPIPNTEVFSSVNTTNYDILVNFNFGNGQNVLHTAMRRNHLTIISQVISVLPAPDMIELLNKKDDDGDTAIHYAATYNSHEMLTEILSSIKTAGLSLLQILLTLNSDGYTAAYLAAMRDDYQVIQIILESLTDSEERLQVLMSSGRDGLTILHIAALRNSVQTVRSVRRYLSDDHEIWYLLMAANYYDLSYLFLNNAALNNSTEMVRTVMESLTAEETSEILHIRGGYAKELAMSISNILVSDLLEEMTTTARVIWYTKKTTEEDG